MTFIIGATAGGFAIAWIGVANTYWFDVTLRMDEKSSSF